MPKGINRYMGVVLLKRLYLIRHCQAEGQEPQAQLTNEGQEQANSLAAFFNKEQVDYIISSTYERAVASIRPLAHKLNLKINRDDRLCERLLSSVDLDNWMEKLFETYQDMDRRLPGGETSREAMERGVSVVRELIELQESNVVIVTHGNLISLILKHYDNKYGFIEWQNLTNPDVFELQILDNNEQLNIERIWK